MNGQSSDKTKHTERTLNTQVRAVTTRQHRLPCVQAEADVLSLVRRVHSMCVYLCVCIYVCVWIAYSTSYGSDCLSLDYFLPRKEVCFIMIYSFWLMPEIMF